MAFEIASSRRWRDSQWQAPQGPAAAPGWDAGPRGRMRHGRRLRVRARIDRW